MSNKQYSIPRVLIGIALLIAAGYVTYSYLQSQRPDVPVEQVLTPLEYTPLEGEDAPECVPVPEAPNAHGTQGMKVWTGADLRTFTHGGDVICVPDGWEAVGAARAGEGWAYFPPTQGGVVVRTDAFERRVDAYENTPFPVIVVSPTALPAEVREANDAMIERAFVKVGALYPQMPAKLSGPVAVLVTAGVAGGTRSRDTRVYPEPGINLLTLVRSPDQSRAEELFVHAVAHLYNRHRPYFRYEQVKPPFPVPLPDWEELVATWTETAFVSRHDWRMKRLEYLMNVHAAVHSGDFARIEAPPFDDRDEFDSITPDVIVKRGAPGIDYQYGHYILAPLSMVAVQGLLMQLAEAGTIEPTSVEQLLAEVHGDEHPSFFHALEELLPTEEEERIHGWMHGGQPIPEELVRKAAEHYRALNES